MKRTDRRPTGTQTTKPARAAARRIAILAAAAAAAAAAILTAAAPAALAAAAHANLITTYPLDGSLLARQPTHVTIGFDQPVGISSDSLVVYTPNGQHADTGGVTHNNPDGVEVILRTGLGNGTYTVAWHVVSADSHPIQGAFTFSIGAASPTHLPAILPAGSHVVSAAYAVTRWLEYVFFAILGGAVAFLIICWPEGARRRGIPALVTAGWAGLFTATLLALLLQGVYAAGAGFGQLLQPSFELTTLHSRLGTALQARQGVTVLAAIVATLTLRRLPSLGARARIGAGLAWGVLTTAIAATWAASDHASTGFQIPLAIVADVVHLVAMAVWVGGLVTLAGFALRGPATAAVAAAVPRFSAIALGCVAALAATGTYEAWRLTGTWGALFHTTYGDFLLVKIGGLGVLIGLGYMARRFVHRRLLRAAVQAAPALPLAAASVGSGSLAVDSESVAVGSGSATVGGSVSAARTGQAVAADRKADAHNNGHVPEYPAVGGSGGAETPQGLPSMRALRRSVTAELAVVTVVLGATALLVNTPTGRESYTPPAHAVVQFDTGGPGGTGALTATVTPARLGPDQVELTVTTPAGQAFRPAQLQASLYLPARNLGPLPVTLTAAGPGHYRGDGASFGFTGQWQLRVTVRSDAFDETTVIIPVTIR